MFLDQLLMMIISMYKTFLVIVLGMAISLSLIYQFIKKNKKGGRLLDFCSIFYNLKTVNKIRLSLTFIKLFCVIGYLLEFKQFDLVHIIFLLAIIIIGSLMELPYTVAFKSLLFDSVLMVGIVLINFLQGYRMHIYSKTGFTIIIIATSIFICVYEIYRFMEEINTIIIRRELEYEEEKKTIRD